MIFRDRFDAGRRLAAAFLIAATVFIRRHEVRLEDEAERAMPGPLPR